MGTDLVVQHSRRRGDAPVGNPVHGGVRAAAAVVGSALAAPTWMERQDYPGAVHRVFESFEDSSAQE